MGAVCKNTGAGACFIQGDCLSITVGAGHLDIYRRTAGVIGVYVLVVAGVGAALQTNSNLTGLLLATILAGLLVRSFGGYLQRGANRLVPIAVSGSGGSAYLEPDETADYEIAESVETANSDMRLTMRRYSRIIRIAWYLTAFLAVL